MKIYIKNRLRRKDEFQFFKHQFVEECVRAGFEAKADFMPSHKYHIRALLRSLLLIFDGLLRILHIRVSPKKAIIITSAGASVTDESFPYYNYEIVPMVWDIWPPSYQPLVNDIKRFNIKTILVTVKSVAERLKEDTGINVLWVPEGIEACIYGKGLDLAKRPNDVFDMGRRHDKYHKILDALECKGVIHGLKTSNSMSKTNAWLPFEEILETIASCKVMICFPRCDTNPRAAGVETLTQRYWEAMLCRCVIVGRAPKELIDLYGYNPVVDVDWSNPENQILEILTNISDYQPLVEKNYEMAQKIADWKYRIPMIKDFLQKQGYVF
ncbi:MAG: hypothetical protein MJZ69_06035 [Bacteroidaceae bacterium]|nr:hypothetical protein [Bacteroidaceae bacterium]